MSSKTAKMTDEEKKKFLKSMGYSGSCLRSESSQPDQKEKKKRADNRVDKQELLNLHKLFSRKTKDDV